MVLVISNQEKNFDNIVGWVQGRRTLSREEIVTEQALSALKENDRYHLGWKHVTRKWVATFLAGGVSFVATYAVIAQIALAVFFTWPAISSLMAAYFTTVAFGVGIGLGIGGFCIYKANVAKYVAKGLIYSLMICGGWCAYKVGTHVAQSYDLQYADHQAKIAKNHEMILKNMRKSYRATAAYLQFRLREAKRDKTALTTLQEMVKAIHTQPMKLAKLYQRKAGISESEFMVMTHKFRKVMEEVMEATVEVPRSADRTANACLMQRVA